MARALWSAFCANARPPSKSNGLMTSTSSSAVGACGKCERVGTATRFLPVEPCGQTSFHRSFQAACDPVPDVPKNGEPEGTHRPPSGGWEFAGRLNAAE